MAVLSWWYVYWNRQSYWLIALFSRKAFEASVAMQHASRHFLITSVYTDWKSFIFQVTREHGADMMTSSNGNISRVTGPLCGNSPVPGEFPSQRPVTRSFGVFFDLRLNKRLRKQSWGWWFETPSRSLWRHCNEIYQESLCKGEEPHRGVRYRKINS